MKPMAAKLSTLPDAPDAPVPAPRRRPLASGNTWGLLLIIFAVVMTGAVAFPTFIILACGMPPALVAALIDNRPGRYASYCVMAANLAGITPVLAALWFGGNSVALAMLLMSDVYVWLGIYGAAAFGWVLIWLLANITEFMLALIANYGISQRRAAQRALAEEWGAGVTGEAGDD